MNVHTNTGFPGSVQITPLLFEGEHLVRVVGHDREPWFVAIDVCRVLGIKNSSDAISRLDDDEKGVANTDPLSRGGSQEVAIISEPGVYRLVFPSRKPQAERFKRWLAHDVIPAIRKNGFYGEPTKTEVLPPTEQRVFPDWTMEEMRTKCSVTDKYRMVYGLQAAQWIMPQLGFPVPPPEVVERGRQLTMTFTMPLEGEA